MTTIARQKSPWPTIQTKTRDGRRQRSNRSRRQIIEAMFELNRRGNLSPTAVEVAEVAGVGLRTVFRHFEDMDSIYEEMTEELSAIVMPKIAAPFTAEDWRERLLELIDRNGDLFELVFPHQVGLASRRHQSEFLQRQFNREINLIRKSLRKILPKHVSSDRTLFAAIELLPTFSTWRRLREDQNLSVDNAKKTLKRILTALLATIDDA